MTTWEIEELMWRQSPNEDLTENMETGAMDLVKQILGESVLSIEEIEDGQEANLKFVSLAT